MTTKLQAFADAFYALDDVDREALLYRMAAEAQHACRRKGVDVNDLPDVAGFIGIGVETACQVISDRGGRLHEEDYEGAGA